MVGETVEVVTSDNQGQLIITDKTVYRGHPNAVPLVSVGDVLQPNQDIYDTVQVLDLGDGKTDNLSVLQGLAITSAIADFDDVVVAPNDTGNWTSLGYRDGEPEVRFDLVGEPGAVESFWDGVHARGVATGKPLADFVNATDPVNPMQFLFDNLLGSNVILISIKPEHFLSDAKGFISRLETLVPAVSYCSPRLPWKPSKIVWTSATVATTSRYSTARCRPRLKSSPLILQAQMTWA